MISRILIGISLIGSVGAFCPVIPGMMCGLEGDQNSVKVKIVRFSFTNKLNRKSNSE